MLCLVQHREQRLVAALRLLTQHRTAVLGQIPRVLLGGLDLCVDVRAGMRVGACSGVRVDVCGDVCGDTCADACARMGSGMRVWHVC